MALIYLCDDDAKYIQMLTDMLTESGHEVRSACSIELFGRLLQQRKPDLAILDMQMPGGGGPVTSKMTPPEVPVIIASGMPAAYQRQWIKGRAAIRFLEKPLSWLGLEAAVRELLPAAAARA